MNGKLSDHTTKKIATGKFYPLGATVQENGVNFALFSRHAREVFLLLFDTPDGTPADIIRLENRTRYIWHAFVHDVHPGQMYGYKICGDYNPDQGLRFNEHKLLIDPYARALTHSCENTDNLLLAYDPSSPEADGSPDSRDNTHIVPRAIVMDNAFDWQGDIPPDIPFEKLIIYETHLKGFTAHPSSSVRHPGTYLGFTEKIPYLADLGINAVELLPVHEFYCEDFLREKGLANYWGYNTISFFAPHYAYSTMSYPGCQVHECKTLVRELHKAGIEVILDVVYNHTAEGNHLGPTFSFRGIDNPTYYRLTGPADSPLRHYQDFTGCGNSFNIANPYCMRLVMDSLRYWVEEMHIDGFRFDLAAALGREELDFEKSASLFDAIQQDPVLNRVKMIAEPWDIETYQVGQFPVEWSEWNGKFRDTVRRFVRGDTGQISRLALRITGSSDLYGSDGRHPYNSINFVTCHDGFTLNDLVTYTEKHNEANKENNRDGTNENISCNCGTEGHTDDAEIIRLRKQLMKNHFCFLFLSLGTPMMLSGDELSRTQQGNNNAYCQDNETSWINWNNRTTHDEIFSFCRKAIHFRKRFPVLQRKRFLLGRDTAGNNIPDISWYGKDLTPPRWDDPEGKTLCFQIDGAETEDCPGAYLLFFIYNADASAQDIVLPVIRGLSWHRLIDTGLPAGSDFCAPDETVPLQEHARYRACPHTSVVLLSKSTA